MSATENRDTALPWSTLSHNLAHFLTRNRARLGDRPAIIWGDKRWTWAELDARVSALAAAFREDFGLGHGDRVLLQSANNNQMTEVMLACWRIGAVWVPANFRQSPDEVAYLAQKAEVRAMVCEAAFPDHAAACRSAAPDLAHVIEIAGDAFGADYEALVARHLGTDVPNAPVDRDDPCWLFFTSGSTGRPKAVVLTHGQLTFTTLNHLNDLMPGTTPGDASLVVAPLSHGAGMHQLTQIAAGVVSILPPPGRFDVAEAWRLVEHYKVTNMFTVPTIVKMLTEHPAVDAHDHSSLRYVIYAGAPMYRADQKHALGKLGKVLVQYFGLGEVTGAITVLPPRDHHIEDGPEARVGTCGFERTGLHVTIQDDKGAILGPHETGEICVAGPAVCAGYYKDDGANAKSFRNGWFLTGDLGHMDAERYLYITGRASDMYISGGSNVYPREIEEVLLTHPDVSEVAILGIADEKWGEVGLAAVVLEDGSAATAEALAAHLDGKVAKYKLPARYVFLEEMPKTGYGKITKKLVREHLDALGLLSGEPA
ncbi:Long-chain-fatty-acid--CoA ligase [Rhodovulum sp. P5]|uniref:acyl-CoA synthetase n=1 Tax=Rhodovulum sp. P5 TaxID=1564506 RepID=UPI0009C26A41|nr:acyl-CoA synthetase [Rhodovulum sp. P5]ARE40351.1 Long-chain-fatty-acid--CoA ligase [Rhodovulum sp. P5]